MSATTTKPQTTPATNGPAEKPKALSPVSTLRDLLEKSKGQMALAMPRHMTPDRMIRVALTAVQRVPKLLECEPLSVVGCVMQAAELGLELSGPLGQAYIIPFWNNKTRRMEAQFQIGYRGFLRLAYNSGQVSTFYARVVKAGDHFKYQYGTNPKLEHVESEKTRGNPTHVYSVLRMKDGASDFEVMSWAAVLEHRDKYSKSYTDPKTRPYSPWHTAPEEMGCKTVIRKLAKRSPLSPEVHIGAAEDEHGETVAAANLPEMPMLPEPAPVDEAQANGEPADGEVLMHTEEQRAEIQGLLTELNWAVKNHVADYAKRFPGRKVDDMSVEEADAEIEYLRGLRSEPKGE
jgi:recombination protein RecT